MDLSIPEHCNSLHSSFPSWDPGLSIAAPAAVCPALRAEHAAAPVPSILSPILHILLENSPSSAGLESPGLVWVQEKSLKVSFILQNFTYIWTANGGTIKKQSFHVNELRMDCASSCLEENLKWRQVFWSLRGRRGPVLSCQSHLLQDLFCNFTSQVVLSSLTLLLQEVQKSNMPACPRPEAVDS